MNLKKLFVFALLSVFAFVTARAQYPAFTPTVGSYVYPKIYADVVCAHSWEEYYYVSDNPFIEPPFNAQSSFMNARSLVVSRNDTPDAAGVYWCHMTYTLGWYPNTVYYFKWPWKWVNPFDQKAYYYMNTNPFN